VWNAGRSSTVPDRETSHSIKAPIRDPDVIHPRSIRGSPAARTCGTTDTAARTSRDTTAPDRGKTVRDRALGLVSTAASTSHTRSLCVTTPAPSTISTLRDYCLLQQTIARIPAGECDFAAAATPGSPAWDMTADPLFSALPGALRPRFSHSPRVRVDPRAERLRDRRQHKIVDLAFVPPFW